MLNKLPVNSKLLKDSETIRFDDMEDDMPFYIEHVQDTIADHMTRGAFPC